MSENGITHYCLGNGEPKCDGCKQEKNWQTTDQAGDGPRSSEGLGAGAGACRARMHCLKTWPEFFLEVKAGNKPFEVRRNDRGFRVGDVLVLQEWDRGRQEYTGDMLSKRVSYLLEGAAFGIVTGFVVMGLEDCA